MEYLEPIGSYLVVEPIDESDTTPGGVILPDKRVKLMFAQAKVVRAGPGAFDRNGARVPMQVKAGDMVLYGKNAAMVAEIGGREVTVIAEDNVCGVVRKAD